MLRTDGISGFALFVAVTVAGCGVGSSPRQQGTGGVADPGSGGMVGVAGATGTGGRAGAGNDKAAGGQGGTSGVIEPVPSVGGEWALIGFEDPVAVQLGQRDGVLGGMGCIAGLDSPLGPPSVYPCRPIIGGTIVGSRARFAFEVDATQAIFYAADVTVSSSGDRLTGLFKGTGPSWLGPMAWLRISYPNRWLSDTTDQVLRDAVKARARSYGLVLAAGSPASGPDFLPDRTYRFAVTTYGLSPLVHGDLGAFWATEMSWREPEQILVVGPVSTTVPELPVGLTLRFNGFDLGEVEATMPSGARYRFQATPPTAP